MGSGKVLQAVPNTAGKDCFVANDGDNKKLSELMSPTTKPGIHITAD
jgi:hypothetical protein